jgi:hypothetical protein
MPVLFLQDGLGWQKISLREISRSLFKYIGRTERREKDKRRMKRGGWKMD